MPLFSLCLLYAYDRRTYSHNEIQFSEICLCTFNIPLPYVIRHSFTFILVCGVNQRRRPFLPVFRILFRSKQLECSLEFNCVNCLNAMEPQPPHSNTCNIKRLGCLPKVHIEVYGRDKTQVLGLDVYQPIDWIGPARLPCLVHISVKVVY